MNGRTQSQRMCFKCKLHGKYNILRGHKRNCPFQHCCCAQCASHEKAKELREKHAAPPSSTVTALNTSSTSTLTSTSTSTQNEETSTFPELAADTSSTVLKVADFEIAKKTTLKSRSIAEKRKGKLRIIENLFHSFLLG